ncbi:Uncharacterised protein [Achromobacter xylosoxidans]|nr:Uncharacterised protein [Achromobacter xylosoxidans]CUJ54456.1 Uncharacterised protein [Achromobacter xylosoxidans]CUJ55439.1 Uncharacterised protein [Achromobacter xylosoxidans]CUJ73355.1 Uncharacterised protein [Achromobacter xylosoxidans]
MKITNPLSHFRAHIACDVPVASSAQNLNPLMYSPHEL